MFDALWHGKGSDAVAELQASVWAVTIWYPENSVLEDEVLLMP